MSTVAIKNTMVMNNTEKKASLVERFKKYVLDNAEYFAAASAPLISSTISFTAALEASAKFSVPNSAYFSCL